MNNNGRTVLEWITNYNLILLNRDQNCTGTYTWMRGEQKSVIDYVLVNSKMYDYYRSIQIDEGKEIFDISHHNLIVVNFSTETDECRFEKLGKWETREFYKTDEISLNRYVRALETKITGRNTDHINTLNEAIKETADEILRKTYRKKVIEGETKVEEPPWINNDIRKEIKKRKQLNRRKRNAQDIQEKEQLNEMYKKQKQIVQNLIKQEMYRHVAKLTKEMKEDKSNKLWDNINKLRSKNRRQGTSLTLYDEEGRVLEKEELGEKIVEFWTQMYQKHENKIEEIWSENNKLRYIAELNERRSGNIAVVSQGENPICSYPLELRDHIDGMRYASGNFIKPMKYPNNNTNQINP